MAVSLGELADLAQAELRGDAGLSIERVETLQDARPGSISFLANPRYREFLPTTRASAVILTRDDAAQCPTACLITSDPYLAHARVMSRLYPLAEPQPGIHASAVVDESASVAASAEIGVNCHIGANVQIGERVLLGPGCVVLDGASIGDDSRLIASVTLCAGTRLGRRCIIHPGAVIGSDGFGMANERGVWVKLPQIGRAILGDDVEVGSCSSIDRGAIGDTVIADGVKIDSQVLIAHNVQIGMHTAIAGCVGIAGSAEVGAYCTFAGNAVVTGHVQIGDHVHVSGLTAVTRSLPSPGVYTGVLPAMPHAVWQKNFARLRHLDDMVRRVKALERELARLLGADHEPGQN